MKRKIGEIYNLYTQSEFKKDPYIKLLEKTTDKPYVTGCVVKQKGNKIEYSSMDELIKKLKNENLSNAKIEAEETTTKYRLKTNNDKNITVVVPNELLKEAENGSRYEFIPKTVNELNYIAARARKKHIKRLRVKKSIASILTGVSIAAASICGVAKFTKVINNDEKQKGDYQIYYEYYQNSMTLEEFIEQANELKDVSNAYETKQKTKQKKKTKVLNDVNPK